MKEGDNAEGRKTRPASLCLCSLEGKAERGRAIRSVSTTSDEGREGKCYCTPHPGAGCGKERENRGKTSRCVRQGVQCLLSKWKCSPLLMEVYLLPIVSRASPVKSSFDGSVFVHGL